VHTVDIRRLVRLALWVVGGADRDRTDDPLLAKQMLSQLSYSPGSRDSSGLRNED
jgi:hypothetical protein